MHTTLKTTKRLPFRYYKSNHHSFITIFEKHTIYCVYIYRFYTIYCIKYTPLCYATKNNTNSNIEFVFFCVIRDSNGRNRTQSCELCARPGVIAQTFCKHNGNAFVFLCCASKSLSVKRSESRPCF